jgi:hypothetical protein
VEYCWDKNQNDFCSHIVIGNKVEERIREVSYEEGMGYAQSLNFSYYEVSARTGYNLSEMFEEIA